MIAEPYICTRHVNGHLLGSIEWFDRRHTELFGSERDGKECRWVPYADHEREKLRELTGTSRRHQPIPDLVGEINRHLRGWREYFRLGYPRRAFRKIGCFVRERLYRHLRRRSQRPFRPPEGTSWYQHLSELGLLPM